MQQFIQKMGNIMNITAVDKYQTDEKRIQMLNDSQERFLKLEANS